MCVRRHKEDHDVEEVTFQRLGQGCKVSSVQLKKKKNNNNSIKNDSEAKPSLGGKTGQKTHVIAQPVKLRADSPFLCLFVFYSSP